jgi:four helix bundle protein
MQPYTDLKVWQRSHALVLQVYRLSSVLPQDERFGLVSQLRRAAASTPTNIAEGSKRRSSRDFAHFLNIAEGSLAELDYLLLLARDLGYVDDDNVAPMRAEVDEIARMLHAFRLKVENAGP